MKILNNNRTILLESSINFSRKIAARYNDIYAYSGELKGAKNLPYDFLDKTDYYMSQYKVGQIIDKVYAEYIKSEEVAVLNEVMNNENAHLIIKKTVMHALGKLLFSFILAEKFIKKHGIKDVIDFVPKDFSYTLYKVVSKSEDILPRNVSIPLWYLKKMQRKEFAKNIIASLAIILYPIGISLLMNPRKRIRKNRKHYKYGVHVWDNWVSSITPPQKMDFLNEDDVNSLNTLYIMEKKISKLNLKKIKSSGYDYCYFKDMVREFSMGSYFRDIYPNVKKIANRMASVKNNRLLLTESRLKILRWYLLWEIFFFNYDVDMFLAVQEPGNISRSLCQKNHDAKNIFIYLSTSPDHLHRDDMNTSVEIYYGLMVYDFLVSSSFSINYFKKNRNFIGEYIDCGILPSDITHRMRSDSYLKKSIKGKLKISKDMTVIGFFDTEIGKEAVFNREEGYCLLNDIYHLLQSNENYYLIFGSRNIEGFLKESDTIKDFEKLLKHERIFYANESVDHYRGYDFMGLCDLVVGCFYSSVPFESVAGGIKTICYSPNHKFNCMSFTESSFPNFCAYGYEDLKSKANYWLNECSGEDFIRFQDTYIKKYVDTYCDGKAHERLSSFLCKCDHIDIEEMRIRQKLDEANLIYERV